MPGTEMADVCRRAEALAEAGDLADGARLLVGAGLAAAAADLVDERILALMSRHQHTAVVEAVEALPSGQRPLLARIAQADAKVSTGQGSTSDLQDLLEQAVEQDRPDLAAFTAAALVEHLMLHGDAGAIFLAMQHLAELPQDALPRLPTLVARARLRRTIAVAKLFLGPEGLEEAETDYRQSLADYNRAGWQVDRWLTVALYHTVRTSVSWATSPSDQLTVREARDQLLALGSPQSTWARYGLALCAFAYGDIAAVQAEVDELARPADPRLSFLSVMAEHLEALLALFVSDSRSDGDAAMKRLTEVADAVRREFPAFVGVVVVMTTHVLLDRGRRLDATEWFGRLQALTMLLPHEPFEREIMACRLAMLSAYDGSSGVGADQPRVPEAARAEITTRLQAPLDGLLEMGQTRMAGALALRCAATWRLTGCDQLAEELRAWAEPHLPAPAERTWWELQWDHQAPAPVTTRRHRLLLLAPSAVVLVDGEPRQLAPAVARMLGVLAARDRPVATEELIDVLWPETDPVAGRGRLKSAHHRLRQTLGPDAADLVRRNGDVWSIAPDYEWSLDVREFGRLAVGGVADRVEALRLPEGFVWQVQFPYDDALAAERAPLEMRWLRLAEELVRTGALPGDEVHRRAALLGLADSL